MSDSDITYKPIGMIHSGHVAAGRTPIQPIFAKGCEGRAEVFPEFADGLRDLEGFSHVYRIETTRNGWHNEVDEQTARQRGRREYTEP